MRPAVTIIRQGARCPEGRDASARNCIPHGGHQFALSIAAGLEMGGNESYPDVFQPFGGFADEIAVEDGRVGLHRSPGVGFEEKANLIAAMRGATET